MSDLQAQIEELARRLERLEKERIWYLRVVPGPCRFEIDDSSAIVPISDSSTGMYGYRCPICGSHYWQPGEHPNTYIRGCDCL